MPPTPMQQSRRLDGNSHTPMPATASLPRSEDKICGDGGKWRKDSTVATESLAISSNSCATECCAERG